MSLGDADCLVLRTCVPFTLASDLELAPVDSWALVGQTRTTEMHLGDGSEPSAVIRGGRITFRERNGNPLMQLLPSLVHVPSGGARSDRVRALLAMIEAEDAAPDPWSASVAPRLLELLLIELFREGRRPAELAPSLLAGMGDPIVSRALTAMHSDIARSWTLDALAKACGRSRSAFNQRFGAALGMAPMTYLQRIRMAVAKEELRRQHRGVAEIALLVGFQSTSAFSAAFARNVGCSPTAYSARSAAEDA